MSIETYDPQQVDIKVTEKALKHFSTSLAKTAQQMIRLSIRKSGCTGYAYVLDYVAQPEQDDRILTLSPTVKLAVSTKAAEIARGTEIDYVLEGVNRVIKFNNPNVIAECGCGESFTV
ncbi:MAG: iron-sulfur cluster assembly accessory protein [Oceanospirillaceae bacterium]|nr:iron-sulfur cluster assembly accessory protein [Oceanospirillaceae bacterium]